MRWTPSTARRPPACASTSRPSTARTTRCCAPSPLNANGRSDEPLLIGDSYRPGRYQLLLHVDDYFAARKAVLPSPAFLTKLPVRFQVANAGERIHLPIQFGPWAYTYSRGS